MRRCRRHGNSGWFPFDNTSRVKRSNIIMRQSFTRRKRMGYCLGVVVFLASACSVDKEAESVSATDFVNPFIGASTSVVAEGVYHGLGKTLSCATTAY